ncbi:MAG: cysteine--tRNA ligase [Legionellaceae bacterium]|nr:cysteine--tRNA ligase [Legionellaceae bacterium]
MLTIYNSLTRKKEPFYPLHANKIGFYVCGNTVYDHCHIGHARSMVCTDVIIRYLRASGYEVKYVRNITDIDDKIIVRAQERGISIAELTAENIRSMEEDAQALHLLTPDREPRATTHIQQIIDLISRLIEKNYAYQSSNGDVCFEVSRFADYGKLSHKDLDGLQSGARIDIVQEKRSPLDFVLWKKAKKDEPSWPSPWGEGRPGWHIECSAMAMDELGEHFDIHAGGGDLQFPHHENEIAQSEAASGKAFANYWLHFGMLQVDNEKMSKSLGNFFTIKEVLATHHPEVLRYFLLSSHYRSALNYAESNLSNAAKALTRLYQALKDAPMDETQPDAVWVARFNEAMNDDFNTPLALAVLFELSHTLNREKSVELAATLRYLGGVLGLFFSNPADFLQAGTNETERQRIEQLIAERFIAKQEKNWARADALRDELLALDIELEDGPTGTQWRRVIR